MTSHPPSSSCVSAAGIPSPLTSTPSSLPEEPLPAGCKSGGRTAPAPDFPAVPDYSRITNAEFANAIFRPLAEGASAAICSKPGNPEKGGWLALGLGSLANRCPAGNNNYCNCASFKVQDDGSVQARKSHAVAVHFIVLDDLGTKAAFELLGDFKLSWLLETSTGNFQGGIILDSPLSVAEAERLLGAIIHKGLCDPGATGAGGRWARLPVGTNGKEKHRGADGSPFRCRLVRWDPERRYSASDVIAGLRLEVATDPAQAIEATPRALPDLTDSGFLPKAAANPVVAALKECGLYKAETRPGRHEITCPWVGEHTGQLDNGAAYFEPDERYPSGGFCCQHSHRDKYHIRELTNFLGVGSQKLSSSHPPPEPIPALPVESDEGVIRRLAELTVMDYDRVRKDEANKLGVQLRTLDEKVKAARRADDTSESLPFPVVAAWPEPIVPADLLGSIVATINRFLILSPEEVIASALWVAHTYLVEKSQHSPLLIVNAPERACGKTRLQTVLGRMACRPLFAANATPSAIFRSIEVWHPTIFIDECDTFLRDNSELIGMINAGYERGGGLLRSESAGDSFTPRRFSVYSAKCIAGIALEKHLPDATMSRGVILNLRRRLPSESVARLRHADEGVFDVLASQLVRFAADFGQEIGRWLPALPDELGDREQDNWEPLLAIAACAGPEWLARATAAALKLSEDGGSAETIGSRLLADIRTIFATEQAADFGRAKVKVTKISSVDLTAALADLDEAPWGTWNHGKPITQVQLASLLKQYRIKSKTVRLGAHDTPKGYSLAQFSDVFTRYLRPTPPEEEPDLSESPEPMDAKESVVAAPATVVENVPPEPPHRHTATRKPLRGMESCGVAAVSGVGHGESGDGPATADLESEDVGDAPPIDNADEDVDDFWSIGAFGVAAADDNEDEPLPF